MSLHLETYQNRPTRALVFLPRLRHNYAQLQARLQPGVRIMGVVKANAYGHGLLTIGRELLELGASCLGVAYLEEAVLLRRGGIRAPIVVMGAINVDQIADFITHEVQITSSSLDKSRAISEIAGDMGRDAVVHLKVDTGMERIGVHWYHAERFLQETLALPHLRVQGVFSHFAKADSDPDFTRAQCQRFEGVLNHLAQQGPLPEDIHLANSEGLLRHPESHHNLVRPGLAMYGYTSFPELDLQPVMALKTRVSFFKVVPEDTGISYDHTYRTSGPSRIVTLPIGYGDGYSRGLSNRGSVLIRGQRHPIAGSVCMDQVMVDLGPAGTAYNGDDVLLFGEDGPDRLPLGELCTLLDTIPYEVLCRVSSRVPRVYVG